MIGATLGAEKIGDASGQSWFAVQLKPNAEAIARRNLSRQGVLVFSPYEGVTSHKGSKYVQTLRPLFPGYLFVSFDPDRIRWRSINSTYGVSRLVCLSGDRPTQIPPELISELMRRCDASGRLLPPQSLQRGDEVSLATGPFADFVGRVEEIASKDRVWILLDIVGKSTRVAVPRSDLRRPI